MAWCAAVCACMCILLGSALAAEQIAVLELGASCQANQCSIDNSDCIDGRCACVADYTEANNTCRRELNSKCSTNEDCSAISGAECIETSCRCPQQLLEYQKTECLPAAKYGDPCKIGEQCTQGGDDLADCIEGSCGCQSGMVFHKDRCYVMKGTLHETCNETSDRCHLEADEERQNVECRDGACRCSEGFLPSVDNLKCMEPVSDKVGSSCEVNHRCYLEQDEEDQHVECKNDICECMDGYEASDDKMKCLKSVSDKVGSSCEVKQRCYLEQDEEDQHVKCKNDICECMDGYEASDDKMKCLKSGAPTIHMMAISSFLVALVARSVT